MNKNEILKKYQKPEDKLLMAKVLDKIEAMLKYNKIENTFFLDLYQQNLIEKLLKNIKMQNYIFYGGGEEVERTMLFLYPNKFENLEKQTIYQEKIKGIRILLPNENQGKYTHKDYLGAVMKLGIKREKIGDILVDKQGADIIVSSEIAQYILENISGLTRFSKAEIEQIEIQDLRKVQINKEEIKIIVASLRLDNIVSELTKTSRQKANEIIKQERVFINFENETKSTKLLKQEDIITIRGKGRFKIKENLGNTKKGNTILTIEKWS